MSTREALRNIFDAKDALLAIEKKITELPYPPVNTGVQIHILELSTSVRMTALEIDQLSLRLELIMHDKARIGSRLYGITGVISLVLWWRRSQALKEMEVLLKHEKAIEDLLDSHRRMIPVLEQKLSMLD